MADRAPNARSFVLDLLSTLRRGAMPVRALVESAALFAIAEGSVRVALTRLLADGLVERDERGLYRLGRAAAPVQGHVAAWRNLEARLRPWSGGWIGVFEGASAARPSRASQRRSERALGLTGFRSFARGLALRPDNLAGGVARLREELAELGLAPGAVVCELHELDAVSDARARKLWDADDLVAQYRRHRQRLEASTRRLRSRTPEVAMAESFRVGGAVLRLLAHDPLLPEPIVAADERKALVDAMIDYDATGRASWSEFMARHGVVQGRSPAAPFDGRAIARGGLR
jgi:phenylacetic acid degradation operon negative regulatory protein